ncbi:hypothetical protein ACFWFQ_36760, partial [Nocardia salmonicida]|uniref:hypothetical protein n=1 Tax=Nocardia salmonicida TaxID=53431 RepID=UPI003651E391
LLSASSWAHPTFRAAVIRRSSRPEPASAHAANSAQRKHIAVETERLANRRYLFAWLRQLSEQNPAFDRGQL